MNGPELIWRFQSRLRLLRKCPLISLVLGVKNGLPVLRKCIDAVRRQTYRKFELLVQDGGSTDGSLEYLYTISDLPRIEILSQPDSGIGQAYNRGLARCTGDIVCLLSCDEELDNDALRKAANWFSKHPNAAVIYGAARLVDEDGRSRQVFFPPAFDLTGVMRNEIVPPICATFLGRAVLAKHLYYDESLKTCPDYDFWLRVGSAFGRRRFVVIPDPIVAALMDRTSMSFRVESFDQFCRDKIAILHRFLLGHRSGPALENLRNTASAGVFTWAAESIFALEGPSPAFLACCSRAAAFDPESARLRRLGQQTMAFEIDSSGNFRRHETIQPPAPGRPMDPADRVLRLEEIQSRWKGAAVDRDDAVRVTTGPKPWSYAAQIPLHQIPGFDGSRWYWAVLEMEVVTGEMRVSVLAEDCLIDEQRIDPANSRTKVFLRLRISPCMIMIRNGALPGVSVGRIFSSAVGSCLRQEVCPSELS